MGKTYCFLRGIVFDSDGHTRITQGDGFRVDGGTKDQHDRVVDTAMAISNEVKSNPPETLGEMRMIVQDAAKKAGLFVKRSVT